MSVEMSSFFMYELDVMHVTLFEFGSWTLGRFLRCSALLGSIATTRFAVPAQHGCYLNLLVPRNLATMMVLSRESPRRASLFELLFDLSSPQLHHIVSRSMLVCGIPKQHVLFRPD